MEVSILTKKKAVFHGCPGPSCSVGRPLCPYGGWGHHQPRSCLVAQPGHELSRGLTAAAAAPVASGGTPGSWEYRCKQALESWAWSLSVEINSHRAMWDHDFASSLARAWIVCISAQLRLSEDSTYCSAFVQATKRSPLWAPSLQLPKFPHLWYQNFFNLWTKVTNSTQILW